MSQSHIRGRKIRFDRTNQQTDKETNSLQRSRLRTTEPRSEILFVSHDASRTGAPRALLHFLRWFKKNSRRPFSILLGADGDLTPEFEELAETWSLDRSRWCPGGRRSVLLSKVGLSWWARRAELRDLRRSTPCSSPVLVYANSIVSAHAVNMLGLQVPVLAHVHELNSSFQLVTPSTLSRFLVQTRRFIACSDAVREYLTRDHAVAPPAVELVYESIPVGQILPERSREQVLQQLRIPRDATLVVGCGTVNHRKGADLFAHLAAAVCRERPNVYFAWIGEGLAPDTVRFESAVREAGLAEKVRLTGAVTRPADYFAAADVFALTSREDPYPLACLEAAAVGKPIICFAGAGGMPEFVEGDCGFVVPYLDIMAMADRVVALLDSPDCRLTMGSAAQRKVAQRHDVNRAAPHIADIIERTIAGT
jgi:glycosyltransferase involved in cell wall biosynthesis